MDRRGFLRAGAGGVAFAMLPLAGCSTDELPPVDRSVGPVAIGADGTRYQVRPNEHALMIDARRFGGVGTGAGKLNFPIGIALAGGLAHVVDCGNHRIQSFDADGTSVAIIGAGELMYPQGIAVLGEELLVADTSHARIVGFSATDGRVTRVLGEGLLSAPRGLAVDGDRIFVADPGLRQVLELDRTGATRRVIGGDWVLPWDVATDGTNVFVADVSASELAVVARNGARHAISLDVAPRFVSLATDGVLYIG
jgi:hypothetical protein